MRELKRGSSSKGAQAREQKREGKKAGRRASTRKAFSRSHALEGLVLVQGVQLLGDMGWELQQPSFII